MARKAQAQAQAKEVKVYDNGFKCFDIEKIMSTEKVIKEADTYRIVEFQLADHVTLSLIENDDENKADGCNLNIGGVVILGNVKTYTNTETGEIVAFMSMPSYKDKQGNYKNLVSILNTDLNNTIKDFLTSLYV